MKNSSKFCFYHPRNYYRFILLLMLSGIGVFFSQCSENNTSYPIPEIWGDLEAGQYSVGFKTLYKYDITKPAVPYSDWDGKLYPTEEYQGRQMQINIWYPAQRVDSDHQLKFGDYVALMGKQTDFGAMDDQKMVFANEQFIAKTNALGDGTFSEKDLQSIGDLKTFAFLDELPVNQEFPLIVFPNGGSPAFQSIMCEYFASHGFIVGAMALKGSKTFTDEASVKGIESAVADLDFGLRVLLEIPQVNTDKIGMIGNAITSSQIVAYQSRNPKVTCVISLEGGLLSNFEQNILNKTAFYEPSAVNLPIMAIYAPHPSIDPGHIDHLIYSDRYFLHFPQMTEFHFLNYGPLDQFIPGIIGDHEGNVKKGYEWGCRYALDFFKSFLKDDSESASILNADLPAESKVHIDSFFIKDGIDSPPDISTLKDAFITGGFNHIDSVFQSHVAVNPISFSKAFYTDFRNWLAWKKDPDYENRYQLYTLAVRSFPESSEFLFYKAYYALETNRENIAREHYRKALEYLDSDDDPTLTKKRRDQIRSYIAEDLKRF